ncbi:MAG TPA: hypothetical protein VFV95_01470 [Vicinamibacterales bacterium]|nr:hypothetical protein [Vicinamibacterales bacterium]
MRKRTGVVVAGLLALSMCVVEAQAPEKAPAPGAEQKPTPLGGPQPAPASPSLVPIGSNLIPIEIQVVISRFKDEKKVSSLPYTLAVNANDPAGNTRLRMGADVAVPTSVFTPATTGDKGQNVNPLTSFSYKSVGTNIDCSARSTPDGRFSVALSVSETSAVAAEAQASGTPRVANAPIFGNFQTNTTLLLGNGQTRQFNAATDRITGEIVRVDVTLRVLK